MLPPQKEEREGTEAGDQAGKAFGKGGAGTGDVETEIALPGLAVPGTRTQRHLGIVTKMCGKAFANRFLHSLRSVEMTKRAAVEPHQVGAFQRGHGDAGQLPGEGLADKPLVLPEILTQGVQPALGLVVCRLQGRHAEDIDVAALVVVDGAVDAAHNVRIPGDDVRDLDAGDVERLCRRAAGAGIPDQLIRQRRKGT